MNTTREIKNQLFRIIILCLALLVFMSIPAKWLFCENQYLCLHYYLFGIQCPFCGMLRAVYQLMHFHFASALTYNFVVVFFPVYLLLDIATLLFDKKRWLFLKKLVVVVILFSCLLLYLFRVASYFQWC